MNFGNLGLVELNGHTPFSLMLPSSALLEAVQTHDRSIYDKMKARMVRVCGISRDGSTVITLSGFIVGPSAASALPPHGLIVTAGHALTPHVERFRVQYADGSEEDASIALRPPRGNVPDLMILEGSRPAKLPQTSGCSHSDTIYALGFGALNELSCSKGTISSAAIGAMTIAAHADNGFSGGPVVNLDGKLVGVVKGLVGTTVPAVGITPAADLHTYLLQAGFPGLLP